MAPLNSQKKGSDTKFTFLKDTEISHRNRDIKMRYQQHFPEKAEMQVFVSQKAH